jgi:uncharacterized membrane protein
MTSATSRRGARIVLVLLYATAGLLHLWRPQPFIAITPTWVPLPDLVVTLTGVAELAGAMALFQVHSLRLRRAAGWGLAAYALCVWPANFNHMAQDLARPDGGLGLVYHVPRLAAQPLMIWLALWASEVINWPFGARQG